MAPKGGKTAALRVTAAEVVAAIESLYADAVRPQGRVLLKRLGERAASLRAVALAAQGQGEAAAVPRHVIGAEVVPRLDTAHIRRVCERCPRIHVVADVGSEYSALLVGRAPDFVDACSNDDPYPERLWSDMAAFFGSPATSGLRLPGGRYACARALAASALPCLVGRSLGEVCHIVQLAITQRRILGYLDGHVVPYLQSEAVVKQQSADLQQPAWSLKKDAMAVADLAQAKECLQAILESSSDGEVPLPNVKRLFRSRFQLELSETALGHCRISDLLQDQVFDEICSLRLRGSTYVVVQRERTAHSADLTCAGSHEHAAGSEDLVQEAEDCIIEQPSSWQEIAERTFIHFKPRPATPARRSRSVPKDLGSGRHSDWSSECTLSPCDSDSTEASDSDMPSPRRLQFCPDEPLSLEDSSSSESEVSFGCPLMTPSPQYDRPYHTTHASQCGVHLPVCQPSGSTAASSAEPSEGADSNEALAFFRSLGLEEFSEIEAIADAASETDDARSVRSPLDMEPLMLEDTEERRSDFPLMTPSPQYRPEAYARLVPARPVQVARPMKFLTTCPRGRVGVSREMSFEAMPCASMRSSHFTLLPSCGRA
mmetsp:Transcript_81602/g.205327  ORF Transcript_81602/g.205327 Transcript_81602/m.205327 type:complete len:600 (+) Transcript_81602:72-1871(+)